MSIQTRAKIIGLDPLVRKLRVLPDKARAKLREALAREADEVVALMRRLAPDDDALQKSIGWSWDGKVPKGAMALATKGKGDLTITVFAGDSDAFYARWWEFGTAPRQHKSGKNVGEMPAQPFFYPGWRASRKGVKAALRKASREAALEVARS